MVDLKMGKVILSPEDEQLEPSGNKCIFNILCK